MSARGGHPQRTDVLLSACDADRPDRPDRVRTSESSVTAAA